MINREDALQKLKQYKPDHYQFQHALHTESIMRAMAPKFDGDPDYWGICGLLHDVDFPLTQDNYQEHGLKARELLADLPGVDDRLIRAIMAHNAELLGIEIESPLEYALRCAETVTGMITAAALVRPNGMQGMEAKSIKKKMKDKSFAAAVSRERIKECEKIGLSVDDFLAIAIQAMS